MKKIITLLMFFFIFSNFTYARSIKEHLSEADVARVKEIRELVYEVQKKSWQQMVEAIEKTQYPKVNLAIQEAMAHTYADIVREQNVQGQGKKEWLYSMIALNMAYFQFGGDKDSAGGTKNLNKLIRYKLKTYLPAGIFNDPGFHCGI